MPPERAPVRLIDRTERALRVALLGSSGPGVAALETLMELGVDIVAVAAHAGEREGAVGASLLRAADVHGIETYEFDRESRMALASRLAAARPDLGFTVGFRFLLDSAALALPGRGWLNVHSSLLPAYRGRAPLNWAILQGERRLGATLHFLDEGVDTGPIVFQDSFPFGGDDDVADALARLDGIYRRLIRAAVQGLQAGELPRRSMPAGGAVWPRRTPQDGRIDWSASAAAVHRLVRAVAPPYPGAFTSIDGRELRVLRARVVRGDAATGPAGLVCSPRHVACGAGMIEVLRCSLRDPQTERPLASLERFVGLVCR